ncbi:IS110 family transposase [Dermacoccus nishinomiyaensis]|uniref:IS110 family transposase n=1 Tax=Dermacoccus nishinomiyaensis TaxID=1274 RepID=UPI0013F4963D|nr:IS110 family transposase [Dermacoccus nishinomiyaensis]NHC32815.1 IS110 family transposase [Dermacoccus nishinomiyaensis]
MNGLPERTYAVYLGLDVGKEHHHACALDPAGKRLHDKTLPQDEQRIRDLLTDLSVHGDVLVVVDQPASIGALPVAVARSMNIQVAYLPGLAMRRIADLHPGNAKTDARDAYVIADAARTLPHALRRVDVGDDALADLEVIVGFDDDLAAETTRVTNRVHGLLTQIHPALERAIGGSLHHPAVLELLSRFGGPSGLRTAGRRRLLAVAKPRAPRKHEAFVDAIMTALDEQTVTVPGTRAADLVLPKLADQLARLLAQRAEAATQVEEMLDAHPLAQVLTSMPGVGVRTGARILLEVGDASSFATPGHLAAYAGLAPVTRRSGTSIRGEHPSRSVNKNLKRAFFLAAFAELKDPASRAYYDRKRAEGKRHNAALICLARRRCDVLYAMLRDGTTYQPGRPVTPIAA